LPRILLVADRAGTADCVGKQLREVAHIVEVADRFVTAQQLADATPYDLALADLQLPDGSGRALVRALHAARQVLPILVRTGRP
jgi:two-component system response regulator TctD